MTKADQIRFNQRSGKAVLWLQYCERDLLGVFSRAEFILAIVGTRARDR